MELGARMPISAAKGVAMSTLRPAVQDGIAGLPGASFGEAPVPARPLDPGMGVAVARRTVFRASDREDFGRVADRVAEGNMALLGGTPGPAERVERARLRNAIASGALLTSGRHLQHGDATQPGRNMEVFTNCATAVASFAKFYLLLNGSGVGRAYDDDLVAVDWAEAPDLLLYLSPGHPDHASISEHFAAALLADPRAVPAGTVTHRVADSREGWAKAVEVLEAMAFAGARGRTLLIDLSDVRPAGAPILGMQGRPASGPVALLRAFAAIRRHVIGPARLRDRDSEALQPWEQALLVDHYLSMEVQVGGARRAARMATKSCYDPGALRFVHLKEAGGLWTANHSLMVDAEFWARVQAGRRDELSDPATQRAFALFQAATSCSYVNGEPGFINGDLLEDHRTGSAWQKSLDADFASSRYQVDEARPLLSELARRAATTRFPMTTNPCGEIALHVTGGYCVIADFAPALACPLPLDQVTPGAVQRDIAAQWDARVEDSIRLAARFLVRANRMDALYGREVARTNRIGVGPTGLHEFAWLRFGLDFHDLLDEMRAAPFWDLLARCSAAAKAEALRYAAELGMSAPTTVTTVKPAGTTSKLFGLTEGAHLPARRQYLRWVQFKLGDPLIADYAARGYPVRALHSFPGVSIVGFPTMPMLQRLGLGARLVTATEASPEEQYRWLELLERYWIGAERGNQVSYTLKVDTTHHDLAAFRDVVAAYQPRVRCCAVLPSRPEAELGYEYLPEEEVDEATFARVVAGIRDPALAEAVDPVHLRCAGDVCPI
jgi:ribonucleoside-triphosphate reductase (formate)